MASVECALRLAGGTTGMLMKETPFYRPFNKCFNRVAYLPYLRNN